MYKQKINNQLQLNQATNSWIFLTFQRTYIFRVDSSLTKIFWTDFVGSFHIYRFLHVVKASHAP